MLKLLIPLALILTQSSVAFSISPFPNSKRLSFLTSKKNGPPHLLAVDPATEFSPLSPRHGGSLVSDLGSSYNSLTVERPVFTKTLTSLFLMSLSFLVSNLISPAPPSLGKGVKHNPLLLLLIFPGLYFPITSHYYYTYINKWIPGTKLLTTLKKSAIGQLTYGPLYTAVFFFSMLVPSMSAPTFLSSLMPALQALPGKMLSDFFPVWRSGVFYWVSVDLISFSFIPTKFITAFVQVASFFWTVYLAIAAR